jgi:hypothetical protein
MTTRTFFLGGAAALLLLAGCGDKTSGSTGPGGSGGGGAGTTSSTGSSTTSSTASSTTSSTTSSSTTTSTGSGGGAPTAADLLALTQTCQVVAGTTKFATDAGGAKTISICQLNGAVFWNADMDVDCDGGQSAICMNDASYLPDTSATDSQGNPLDASTLPYFVIPLPSNGFDYAQQGIQLGSVGAVIYNGQIQYGIFGDEGPKGMIGEASYAMASLLGVDPDPNTGGVDSGVTYLVFQGPTGVVSKNEDHAEAVTIGEQRAKELLQNN